MSRVIKSVAGCLVDRDRHGFGGRVRCEAVVNGQRVEFVGQDSLSILARKLKP